MFLGKKCWYKVLYSAYLLNEMRLAGTMDLNKPPPEFDYDFLDGVESNPSYCTQATPAISSLQVQTHQTDQDVGGTLIADGEHQGAHGFAVNTEEAIGDGVLEKIVEGVLEGVVEEVVEKIWLTPPVPYTGQTFSSKQEAREFYNSYAKRIGFSIRTSTTRLSSLSREQNKVQFVCNKEGRGRKVIEDQGTAVSDDSNYDEEDSEDGNDGSVKKKKLDGGKKRKREKM